MKQRNGFTLIELVVVIVVLGILAAVAAPKFFDVSGDARRVSLESFQGSLKSANKVANSRAGSAAVPCRLSNGAYITTGNSFNRTCVAVDNSTYLGISDGYITPDVASIKALLDDDAWTVTASGDTASITNPAWKAACKLDYTNASGTISYTLPAVTDC